MVNKNRNFNKRNSSKIEEDDTKTQDQPQANEVDHLESEQTTMENQQEPETVDQNQSENNQNNIESQQNSETKDQTQETQEITESQTVSSTEETKETNTTNFSTQTLQTQKGFRDMYNIELELNNYAEAMDKSKAISPTEGGKWQYSLYKVIKSIFSAKTQEDFNNQFNTVLKFFHKNKDGIFNEKFIFRFPGNWPGSESEYVQNRRLLYLIIQTANPATRKAALKEVNMEMITEGMTENQKQMLFNFYKI